LQTLPGVQATWGAWKALYPHTQILSEETGFARNYANDPFVIFGYSENEDIFFVQAPPIDRRMHPKAMVYGLAINGKARAYPYELLAETNVVNDHFGEDVLIVYHPEGQMPLGYVRRLGDTTYHFSAVGTDDKGFPLLADAETGSTWNVLGMAIDGPLPASNCRPLPPIAPIGSVGPASGKVLTFGMAAVLRRLPWLRRWRRRAGVRSRRRRPPAGNDAAHSRRRLSKVARWSLARKPLP